MRILLLIAALSVVLVSCENRKEQPGSPAQTEYDSDNTARNVRDRDSMAKTSFDQSESTMDRTVTQKIRQALMADDALSTNAKNIKVITINGVVTLRGPVANLQEKEEIVRKVSNIQGINRLDDQLEVTRR